MSSIPRVEDPSFVQDRIKQVLNVSSQVGLDRIQTRQLA